MPITSLCERMKDAPECDNLLEELESAQADGLPRRGPKEIPQASGWRRPAAVAAGGLFGLALLVVFLAPHWHVVNRAERGAVTQLSASEEKGDPCKPGTKGALSEFLDCNPPSLIVGEESLEARSTTEEAKTATKEASTTAKEATTTAEPTTTSEEGEAASMAPAGPQRAGLCGLVDEDTDYVMHGEDWFDHVDNVGSRGACCDLCRAERRCAAWTWVKDANLPAGNPGQCWLKSGKVGEKSEKAGVTSGLREPAVEDEEKDDGRTGEKTMESEGAKEEEEADHECAKPGASCQKSKCCQEAGHQCFTKDDYWAQCMVNCTPGPNPLDQVSPMPWQCKALGDRAPGKPKQCSAEGEDCTTSRCCLEGGMQCYQKNATWAQCKPSCTPGPDMMAEDWKPWSCKALGDRAPGAAPWVKTKCAAAGTDCSKAACCAESGMQCYRQSMYYAQCKKTCVAGEKPNPWDQPWDCTPVGSRTPDAVEEGAVATGKVAPWVVDHCKEEGENCVDAQCCHAVGATCYTKNKYYGSCKTSCSTEPDPNDNNATWDCDALGPKSLGLALKGYPSLFCFTLYMPSRYEGPLMKAQLKAGAGIFSCDGYDVLSQEPDELGVDQDGKTVKAIQIPKISVGVSQDGTAGNAKLFMAVWDKIIAGQRFRNYDWTIKVDPDAVIVPWRVRTHMKPHAGLNVYVVNCNKFPGSPNFPMMYGAVEIFSNLAMLAYAAGSWKCGTQLPWKSWGEDYYMTHCLDFLGVGRISDFGTLGDNLCTGANCADTYTASFHPFKDIGTWMGCWGKATGPPPPPAPAAPQPAPR